MVQGRQEDGRLIIALTGFIDSSNTSDIESDINALLKAYPCTHVELDCDQLQYATSAGLRVILAMQKRMLGQGSMKVVNVNEIIMEIFEITGFADILTIE